MVFESKRKPENKQIELGQENIDGVMYYVAEFTKSYLFPQRAGQLTIEPMEIDCIVRKRRETTTKYIRAIFWWWRL